MCYVNGQTSTKTELLDLVRELEADKWKEIRRPVLDGLTYPEAPVIVNGKIEMMEWGFIPDYWSTREEVWKYRKGFVNPKGQFVQYTTLNAKGEEILEPRKMFNKAARETRCLVLSTGFFEWRHINPIGKKGQPLKTAVKYPYSIKLIDRPVFCFAGIYHPWTDQKSGEEVNTFTIVTTEANDLMARVHNKKKRMPVILTKEEGELWMSSSLTDNMISELAQSQYPTELMTAHPVAKDFKAMDNPTAKFDYAELPPLFDSDKGIDHPGQLF